MRAEELDYAGKIFGFKIVKRDGHGDLVKVYLEDDEWWTEKFSIDAYWLGDLKVMADTASSVAEVYNGH